jgi:cytochrome oxidase assembly protein ShyY1
MNTLAKQWMIGVLGTAICVAMLGLGLWQMRVFESKESESAAAVAALPPVPLGSLIGPEQNFAAAYGHAVTLEGRYLPDQQLRVVGSDGTVRVLSAFQVDDGRVLAVVRGTVPAGDGPLPPPPAGRVSQSGVLLPSEEAADEAAPEGSLGSVRLPALAQLWAQQLLPGFITLPAADSASQGLGAATVQLPTGEGSFTNIGYALQWWVFAAFGAFMTIRFVRALGRQGTLGTLSDQEEE